LEKLISKPEKLLSGHNMRKLFPARAVRRSPWRPS
jgi:hypothetical protein